jgi:hypothetical protein
MSIQFEPDRLIEIEYDKRAYFMIRGIKEGRMDLAANSVDLKDLDVKLAEQGEK